MHLINYINNKLFKGHKWSVKALTKCGKIQAYEHKAMTEAQNLYLKDIKGITYYDSKKACLNNTNTL